MYFLLIKTTIAYERDTFHYEDSGKLQISTFIMLNYFIFSPSVIILRVKIFQVKHDKNKFFVYFDSDTLAKT